MTPLVTRRSLLGACGASGNAGMGECFTLQGLAGVTGVFRGLPPRILRMEVRAAEPAVTRWGPGDNLWVLQNVGDTGRDHSEDFCQGSRSSRQLRGERVWLKKLRERDRPAATIRCHTRCPCALPSVGRSLPNSPIPSRQWKCFPSMCEGAQAWERFPAPSRG